MSAFQNLMEVLGTGPNAQNIQQQKVAGAQMRDILTKAKYPVPSQPIPFDEMEKLYNSYIDQQEGQKKQVFDLQQKELSQEQIAHQTAQQQGEGLLNAAGQFAPGIEPNLAKTGALPDVRAQFLTQLQNSGGLTPEAQALVKPGVAQLGAALASGQIKRPLDEAQYGKGILPNAPDKEKQTSALEKINAKVADTGVASLTKSEKELWDHQQQISVARAQSYAASRPYAVIDTQNQNTPTFVTGDELKRAQVESPGRYAPPGAEAKALNQQNLISDIHGSVQLTREALTNLKTDFTPEFRTKIAFALRSNDPASAIQNLISSQFAKNLTSDQQDYLIAITQLHEQALAMRSVLGAGQSSEDLRAAIRATIPGVATPTSQYGLKQLDALERTIGRLERGIPKVKLRTDVGNAPEAPPKAQPQEETKVLGGTTYIKKNGQWYKK